MIQQLQHTASQGLVEDYPGSNNRSDFDDPGCEWFLYGIKIPPELGKKLDNKQKRIYFAFWDEKSISESNTVQKNNV